MAEDKLSRTKVKYKMSQDVVAQLQEQLLSISQEVCALACMCACVRV